VAQVLPTATVFLIAAAIPIPSLVAALMLREPVGEPEERPDARILLGGLGFGAAMVALGVLSPPFGAEIAFALTLGVLVWLLGLTVGDMPRETKWAMAAAGLVIFAFRAAPQAGAGAAMVADGRAGLRPGLLRHAGADRHRARDPRHPAARRADRALAAGRRARRPRGARRLPQPADHRMLFGLHEWTEREFGFGARTIGLVDTALSAPLAQLGMIPMLTLIAMHAPPGRRATWFALMASLMNLALQAGALISRGLNAAWPVERGDYAALPELTIAATLAGPRPAAAGRAAARRGAGLVSDSPPNATFG
jgi:hypothetical protein